MPSRPPLDCKARADSSRTRVSISSVHSRIAATPSRIYTGEDEGVIKATAGEPHSREYVPEPLHTNVSYTTRDGLLQLRVGVSDVVP